MNNPLERDDVVAALFAAEVNKSLKYVDNQTTNRPSAQPPASRLDPKSLLKQAPPNIGQFIQNTQSNPVQPTIGGQIAPQSLSDLLIPMPDVPASQPQVNQIVQPTQSTTTSNAVTQLELPGINIIAPKTPSNALEWFKHLESKLSKLESSIETRLIKINNQLESLCNKKRKL